MVRKSLVLSFPLFFLLILFGCYPSFSKEKRALKTSSKVVPPKSSKKELLLPQSSWNQVVQDHFSLYYTSLGSFYPEKDTVIGSEVNGIVKKIYFHEGDYVEKGKVLLELDSTFLDLAVERNQKNLEVLEKRLNLTKTRLRQAKLGYNQAKLDLRERQTHFHRIKKLWKKGDPKGSAITQDVYDTAYFAVEKLKLKVESAKIQIQEVEKGIEELQALKEQAKVALKEALAKQEKRRIKAPFSGVIQEWLVEVGSKITTAPATKVAHLSKIDVLKLRFPLPQKYYSYLISQPKIPISFRILGQKRWHHALLNRILPQVDPQSRNLHLEGWIKNSKPPFAFLPGMLVEVRIKTLHMPKVFILPRKAVFPSSQGSTIWIKRKNEVLKMNVTILAESDSQVAIKENLHRDDLVLVLSKKGELQ